MMTEEQYEKDCKQLGELLLRVDGTTRTFCSAISSAKEIGVVSNDIILQYFDTTDETRESKYRIVFGITEI
jgi:hypothetical protein